MILIVDCSHDPNDKQTTELKNMFTLCPSVSQSSTNLVAVVVFGVESKAFHRISKCFEMMTRKIVYE